MVSGNNPFVVFAEASILMKCKIQTLCIETDISLSFTPPEVIDEDCIKILYYHQQDFTICQRVVEMRRNEENKDSNKQMEPDFALWIEKMNWKLFRDYIVVHGYDY